MTVDSWKQLKVMFGGEECHAPETLVDNRGIIPEAKRIPTAILDAIQTTKKKMRSTSGIREMKLHLISAKDLKKPYILLATISLNLSPPVNSPTIAQKETPKLSYYNIV